MMPENGVPMHDSSDVFDLAAYIRLEEGVARVVNNKKLYLKLLGSFKGQAMTEAIVDALQTGDLKTAASTAHALKGTALNLALPAISDVAGIIETQAKAGEDPSSHVPALTDVMNKTAKAIQMTIDKEAP